MNKTAHSRLLPGIPNMDAPDVAGTQHTYVQQHISPYGKHQTLSQHASSARGRQRSRRRSNSDPGENREHYSRRSVSARSKNSSSISSKASMYMEQKAKVAALKAEAKFRKENQASRGTEEWELGKEIAKAEAVADVYSQEETKSVRANNDKYSGSTHVEDPIVKLLQLQSAPLPDMDDFDGNPLEFNYFMATFKEMVEQKVDDPGGRLTRLINYTKGEPKELIKSCIQEDPATGYTHAMSLLRSQYGNPHYIARAYIQELRKWIPLTAGDSKAFRKFYSFLVKCKTCMSDGIYLNELNFPDMLQILQSKLPHNLQDKWNRRAVKLRVDNNREANFNDFLKIVENESMVANDPMYSREALHHIGNSSDNNNNNFY